MPPTPVKQSPKPIMTSVAKGRSVIDRIQPIGFEADDGINIALYGRSGTGKTTLWATFPKPILAVIISGGNQPGELRSVDTPDNRKSIMQVTLEKSSEIRELAEHAASGKFRTVVVDHISGLQDLVLKEILGIDEIPQQKSWGLATQQQYGQCTLQCKELLKAVLVPRTLNTVLIAHERSFKDDGNDSDIAIPHIGAAVTPSLASWVNGAVDYVCQTFIRPKEVIDKIGVGKEVTEVRRVTKEVEYCLRAGPHAVFMTKFRIPKGKVKLPEVIVDPDFGKIVKLIRG